MQVWNPDGQAVEMESVDARECVKYCGYTTAAPDAPQPDEVAAPDAPAADAPAADTSSTKTGKAAQK